MDFPFWNAIDLLFHFRHSTTLALGQLAIMGVDTYALNDRQFICVEYPGRVNNIDRAVETLGGQQAITAVHVHIETTLTIAC